MVNNNNCMIRGRLLYKLSAVDGLLFRNLSFYRISLTDGSCDLLAHLPCGWFAKLLSRFRLTNRLKRLEPKCAGRLSECEFVVCLFGKIWLLDINTKKLSIIAETKRDITVLNFCEYEGSLFFGDYGINRDYYPVNIYSISKDKTLSIIYTFRGGAIRHIHNIVYDKSNSQFWILTGDNEKEAGIYTASLDWTNVKVFATGQQMFRAVVAFPCEGGLIYATDSVENENFIYKLQINGKIECLTSINGSCIYGTQTHDYLMFSTTVEPSEGLGKMNVLSNKLGRGIKSREVHIVLIKKKDFSAKVIAKFEKDCLPMKLFQYGRIIFPGGQQDAQDLWAYNIACKHIDGKSFKIEI